MYCDNFGMKHDHSKQSLYNRKFKTSSLHTSGVNSEPYRLVRSEFFLPEPKPVQKHICFVPVKIPVIPGYFGLTVFRKYRISAEKLIRSGTEKSRLSDLKKKKKKKKKKVSLTDLIFLR